MNFFLTFVNVFWCIKDFDEVWCIFLLPLPRALVFLFFTKTKTTHVFVNFKILMCSPGWLPPPVHWLACRNLWSSWCCTHAAATGCWFVVCFKEQSFRIFIYLRQALPPLNLYPISSVSGLLSQMLGLQATVPDLGKVGFAEDTAKKKTRWKSAISSG